MAQLRKILSIDGGGIRGLIPAIVLAEIEKRSGKRIAEMFDLVAGTSTGGILALGLVMPDDGGRPRYTADELAQLYREKGEVIFSSSFWYKLYSIFGWNDAKYHYRGLEKVLDTYFGNARLKDAIIPTVITSYEIERCLPWFFKSWRAADPELEASYDFPMKKVARATSAAPTFFDPLKLEEGSGDDYYALVDGGVFANNPSMCAYVEARDMFPGDDLLFVSLGTGELTERLSITKTDRWGLVKWARPVLNVVFDGVADTVSYQLKKALPGDRYYRFQLKLTEQSADMDNAGEENLRELKLLAEEMISREGSKLDRLCSELTKPGEGSL